MPTVVQSVTSYPSIQTITDLVRTDVRDDMAGATGTIGEGQILVDNQQTSVTMSRMFNSAVRELSRQLRLVSAPMLIADNYIIADIPPMNGPMGFQVADPSVQVYVGFNGYYDGTQWLSAYALPQGLFQVIRCWERQNASQNTFNDMGEPADGLPGVYQTNGWGCWEWRQDMVCLPGSLDYRDLRIRYLMILNAIFVANANPATTYLPIMDCEEAIARKIERMYALRQNGGLYAERKQEEMDATNMFLNEQIHRQQGTNYQTLAYGSETFPVANRGI